MTEPSCSSRSRRKSWSGKGKGSRWRGTPVPPLYVDRVLANRSSRPPDLRIRSSRRVDPEGSRMGDGAAIPVPTR